MGWVVDTLGVKADVVEVAVDDRSQPRLRQNQGVKGFRLVQSAESVVDGCRMPHSMFFATNPLCLAYAEMSSPTRVVRRAVIAVLSHL